MFQDLNHIPLFVAIAQSRSLSAAADKLHLPIATVSRKLAEMERQSGVRLIQRNARQFLLTEAGQLYFDKAELLCEQIGDAQNVLKQSQTEISGAIRMTMPADFGTEFLADCLTSFIKLYPDVKIELDLSAKRINFTADNIDLALRMGPLDDSSQVSRNLGFMSRSIYGAPLVASGLSSSHHPKELDADSFVLHESLTVGHLIRLKNRNYGERITLTCNGSMRVNSLGMLLSLVVAGAGIGVIPDAIAQPWLASGKLQQVIPDWQAASVQVHLLYRERALLPDRIRLLIAHIQSHLMSIGVMLKTD